MMPSVGIDIFERKITFLNFPKKFQKNPFTQRHVTILESQSIRYRSQPNRENQQSAEVRHVLNSIKSDWRNVVSLLAEVEDEKRKNELSVGFLLKINYV